MDFQVWCGPAIGAFNQWTKGSILEKPESRECVSVGQNLRFFSSAYGLSGPRQREQMGWALAHTASGSDLNSGLAMDDPVGEMHRLVELSH